MSNTLDILERLVGFDTVSHRSNLPLVDYARDRLGTAGVGSVVLPTADGRKAALFATIGPRGRQGVVLSAHTDVVPVEGQDWSGDPFSLAVRDGRAYGRGACDMKGFAACVLAAVPALVKAGLETPVHIALSYDEEVGCIGVQPLIDHIAAEVAPPRACIVGEPSRMRPIGAHTGKSIYDCDFGGTPMHSSLAPRGVSAISLAAEAIVRLDRFQEALADLPTDDARFPIAHPTLSVGTIRGGSAVNIVAERCTFAVEYRHPPGTPDHLLADELARICDDLRQRHPDGTAGFRKRLGYPAFAAGDGSEALRIASALTGVASAGAVNYGTDAGHFGAAGIPTVVIGPGDIAQAHQPDEFIEVSELAACDRFLADLGRSLRA